MLGVSFIFVSNYFTQFDSTDTALENSSEELLKKEKIVDSFLKDGVHLLSTISTHKVFKTYLSEPSNVRMKYDVVSMFKLVANSNNTIAQIRYIDSSGMERIKIDKKDDEVIYRDDYQNKNNRYYFLNAKKTQKPFYSAFDLSTNGGIVEEPFRPTIRAVMPLYDGSQFKGVLVINLDSTKLFKTFTESPLYKFIMFDSNGSTMYHYSPSNAWGNSLAHRYNLRSHCVEADLHLNQTGLILHNSHASKFLELSFPVENGVGLFVELSSIYNQRISDKSFHHTILVLIAFLMLVVVPIFIMKKYWSTVSIIEEMLGYNTQLKQEKDNLQEFVHKDALTGIYNIKKFDSVFHDLIVNYLETKKPFSLMIVDIDDFKQINTKYSFKTANSIIKGVVDCINLHMRESYTFIRYGGVKFVIFLPNTRLRNSVVLAEKIRTAVEKMDKSFEGVYIDVTVSIGVDSFQKNDFDATFFERVQAYTDTSITDGGNKVTYNEEKYRLSKG